MTVRTIWCTQCEENCYDHTSICTICGTDLIELSSTNTTTSNPLSNNTSNGPRIRAIDFFLPPEQATTTNTNTNIAEPTTNNNNNTTTNLATNVQEIRELLRTIQDHISTVNMEQQTLLQQLLIAQEQVVQQTQNEQQLQLQFQQNDNNNTINNNLNGTNTEYLQNSIPRTILQYDNNIFHTASVSIYSSTGSSTGNSSNNKKNIPVTVAEFGTEHCIRMYSYYNKIINNIDNQQQPVQQQQQLKQQQQQVVHNVVQKQQYISYTDNTYLVIADPITGIGNTIRQCCIDEIHKIIQYHDSITTTTIKNNTTEQQDQDQDQQQQIPLNIILFFKRGDNITFVRKALVGQNILPTNYYSDTTTNKHKVNIVGIIIGNNTIDPWPYIMKDSKNESSILSVPSIENDDFNFNNNILKIPVVMTSLKDCQSILQLAIACKKQKNMFLQCNFTLHRHAPNNNNNTKTTIVTPPTSTSSSSLLPDTSPIIVASTANTTTPCTTTSSSVTGCSAGGGSVSGTSSSSTEGMKECIICTDYFQIFQTIVTLPCTHVFHESCALVWLKKHNTCPYCRYTLPSNSSQVGTTISNNIGRPALVLENNGTIQNNSNNNSSTMFG